MTCPACGTGVPPGPRDCPTCGARLPVTASLGPGALVASRYEILGFLGAGGMGTVLRAHDRALDETVALKIVQVGGGPREREIAARLRSEIKLAWRVRHKNVCGIHEYGEDGDLLYISMELVEGHDLKRILSGSGGLPWQEAYDVVIQAADGLEAVHEAGLIHRDLKPANITIDARGLVRLMDFGIARALGEDRPAALTGAGHVVGSPEYMSPEQVRGLSLDARSDLYSLGIVVFETFTGRVPYHATTPVATMLLHLEAPPLPEGPGNLQIPAAALPVLRKALARDRAERFSTSREMANALRAARAALETQPTDDVTATHARLLPDAAPAGPSAAARGTPAAATRCPPLARLLVPALVKALKHEDRDVRAGAAQALGRAGSPELALAPLIETLADPAREVRLEAARALGSLGRGQASAETALRSAEADTDERVRAAASEALRSLSAASAP